MHAAAKVISSNGSSVGILPGIGLAGAMPGRQAQVIDYLETYIFNSDKCFAVLPT